MYKLPEAIEHIIEAGKVPSPPQVLIKLMQMVDNEQITMDELAALVGQDAGLVTRVLTAANSPALRRGTELQSLESCLTSLGTRMIRSIATCLSVQSLFERQDGVQSKDLVLFWAHSLLVAELSRQLAEVVGYRRPDEAYLAGLMHDVGELILLSALGAPYAQLVSTCPYESLLTAEETAGFGVHHGEAGAWMVDKWQLDAGMADAILFHHALPEDIETAGMLPRLVWFAHALSFDDETSPQLLAQYQQLFGETSAEALTHLREQAVARTHKLGEALGLPLPDVLYKLRAWAKLDVAAFPDHTPSAETAQEALSAMVAGKAVMQPLQQDMLELHSDTEVMLAIRESARILFDIGKLAFLRCKTPGGPLSGQGVEGQPAVFQQIEIPQEARRSLMAAAAVSRQIYSSFDAPESGKSLLDVQFARALGSEGLLVIPMLARDQVQGVMVCGLNQAHYQRLQRQQGWLSNFGKIAGASLAAFQQVQDFRHEVDEEVTGRFSRQARRIVHEAGNPLGIIKSYLKILDRKLPEESEVRNELGILNEEISRVSSIVSRMSEIPAGEAPTGGVDMTGLVRELLALYSEALFKEKSIQIDTVLPATPLPVKCERNSLKQILVNLWKNTSEALSAGQKIKITLIDQVNYNGQDYAQISMEDTGPGMPEAAIRSIHRPLEAAGAGARGMGLSIVGELSRRQGIQISCHSQAGKGTTIQLLIPRFIPALATTASPRGDLAPLPVTKSGSEE
ncbi:HDOD domain-containing protein [Leeia oryzae]|uniref:HDOD domain-containing protein n=1 Tax=Leeia oryzae TaxID=356662 RepID=UPI000376EEBF|nr:HDOD domain-containing protein [Leeia oryzae]